MEDNDCGLCTNEESLLHESQVGRECKCNLFETKHINDYNGSRFLELFGVDIKQCKFANMYFRPNSEVILEVGMYPKILESDEEGDLEMECKRYRLELINKG